MNDKLTIGGRAVMGAAALGFAGAARAQKPMAIGFIYDKPGKGAFHATRLGEILAARKISHLVLAGVTTEVCVQTTMREANDRGFDCLLAEDATESYFPEFKKATIDMIRAQGAIVGWTATVEQIATALV